MHKLSLVLLLSFGFIFLKAQNIHHNIYVNVNIPAKSIEVVDSMEIPQSKFDTNQNIYFEIGSQFKVSSLSDDIYVLFDQSNSKTDRYKIFVSDSFDFTRKIPVTYKTIIDGKLNKGEDYNKSFTTTDGIILNKGAYLSGATNWIPDFNELFTFYLESSTEMVYTTISQGEKVKDEIINERKVIGYECIHPMEEVYLIVGQFFEYERNIDGIMVQAFFRKEEKELANKYFDRTEEDLQLYQNLIGDYPFSKFALIENFWETGYGMPSFTLLGPKVIRFPWIIRTSYPHELLHNWWGNSVYVDYTTGNWCEGITAYMADHLFNEQIGQGVAYRRTELKKYNDFVNTSNDFPLSKFKSRTNAAEQAIGYGKSLMVFHMLRMEYGDEAFVNAWKHFYQNNKFTKASYFDIQKSFEYITKENLGWYFDQWVNRKGAPEFSFVVANVKKLELGSEMTIKIVQKQAGEAFRITVPMVFYVDGEPHGIVKKFHMTQKSQNFKVVLSKRPYKIALDPEFDLFRKIDNNEVPPSFSEFLGAKKVLIVIPRMDDNFYKYENFAQTWQTQGKAQGKKYDVLHDREVMPFPEYDVIWVLGEKNRFRSMFRNFESMKSQIPLEHQRKMDEIETTGTLVYAIPNPDNSKQTLGYMVFNNKAGFRDILRKLPHYGKYSYIGFEGDQSQNRLKGYFPASNSPLVKIINISESKTNIGTGLPKRTALGE